MSPRVRSTRACRIAGVSIMVWGMLNDARARPIRAAVSLILSE